MSPLLVRPLKALLAEPPPARAAALAAQPGRDRLAMAHVPHAQLDQVAAPELAVDSQVEQSEFAATIGELQSNADRPDLSELERCFLADELALVPGLADGGCTIGLFHGWLPKFEDQPVCAPAIQALLTPNGQMRLTAIEQ